MTAHGTAGVATTITHCGDGTPHRFSEWRYDEATAGAVRSCERCDATITRGGELLARPTSGKAAAAPGHANDTASGTSVLAALGGSILTEELRGDLLLAARRADQLLYEATDDASRTDAEIARAVVHIMAGEIHLAQPLLADALERTPTDVNRRVRGLGHVLDSMHRRWNLYPDRSGSGATEISARWSGVAELLPLDTAYNDAMRAATDDTAQFEAWLTYAVGSQLLPARYMLDARRYAPSEQALEQVLSMVTAGATQLHSIATSIARPSLTGYADWIAADLHRRAGDLVVAQALLKRARIEYAAAGDDTGVALCLMTQADWACAPFSSPLCWNFAIVDSSGPSSTLSTPLESAEGQGGVAASYDDAEQHFRVAGASRGLAAIALRRCYLASLREHWNDAASHAARAHALFTDAGDQLNAQLAATHLLMAELSGASSDVDPLARAQAIGSWGAASGSFSFTLGLGILVNRLARHWLLRRGHAERALACSAAARTLFEALGASINAAQCLVDAGLTHKAVGDRRIAMTLLEQALDRYTALAVAHPPVARSLQQRVILLAADTYQLALQDTDPDAMERNAARLSSQLKDLPTLDGLQQAMAALQQRMAALAEGIDADPGTDEAPDVQDMLTLVPLGRMASSIVQHAAVLAPTYRARAIRNAGDTRTAEQLLVQAEAAVERAPEGEREMLRAVVRAERKDYAGATVAMRQYVQAGGANAGLGGDIAGMMQSMGGAQADAEVALQQRRTHEQAFTAFVMVHAWDDAAQHLAALERIAGTEWWKDDGKPWQPLSDLAELHENRGDLPRARHCYAQAVEQLEQRRAFLSRDELKVALASDKGAQYLYFLAARAAVEDGDAAAGFEYAERGKARALLDLMASARGSAAMSETPTLCRWRERSMEFTVARGLLAQARAQRTPDTDRITLLESQVRERETSLHAAERALQAENPRFRELVSPTARLLDATGVQRSLPDDGLLLEFFMLGEGLLVWAIPQRGPVVAHHAVVDVAAITRDVQALQRACDDEAEWRVLAASLSDTLLAPFASQLATAGSLWIVPHGALHLLPFHLLAVNGDLLCAAHDVSYLPSASTLSLLGGDAAPVAHDRILVVGNPTGDLPAARAEAEMVAAHFPQAVLLLEDAATEQAVRAQLPGMPLLHFATHGKLDAVSPLDSSVSLAHEQELTVYELMSLRLDARLVVLSACSTGQGATTGGDDLLGLTRGLLAAGARAAIVTLWPVDDQATALFMGEFYARLRAGGTPRAALRAAQHHVRCMPDTEVDTRTRGAHRRRRDTVSGDDTTAPMPAEPTAYAHPYFWAPFILVGL